jgi:hypothetical protein
MNVPNFGFQFRTGNSVHLSVVGSGVDSRVEQVERACLN